MIVANVLYKTGVEFDQNYYENKHLPLVKEKLTPLGLKSFAVEKVIGTADGSTPPYQVIFSMYFESMEAFQAAQQHPNMGAVRGDIPNYYKANPEVLVGETL